MCLAATASCVEFPTVALLGCVAPTVCNFYLVLKLLAWRARQASDHTQCQRYTDTQRQRSALSAHCTGLDALSKHSMQQRRARMLATGIEVVQCSALAVQAVYLM